MKMPSLYDIGTMGATFVAGVRAGRGEPFDMTEAGLALGPLALKSTFALGMLVLREPMLNMIETSHHREIARAQSLSERIGAIVDEAEWKVGTGYIVSNPAVYRSACWSHVKDTAYLSGASFTVGAVFGYLTK